LGDLEGRDVNEADESGCTALIMASQDGHVEVVRLLLARQDVELNQAFARGGTALMLASQNGHLDVVRLLLSREGVEVNKSAAELSAFCSARPRHRAATRGP
jgi:ankyrin repeat protein